MNTLVKHDRPQLWEMVSNRGKQLMAYVDSYHLKVKTVYIAMAAIVLVVGVGTMGVPYAAKFVGAPVGWVTTKVSHFFTKTVSPTPAMAVRLIGAVQPTGQVDVQPTALISIESVPAQMNARLEVLKSGTKPSDCQEAKINQQWAGMNDFGAHCRFSSDGKRLWVWHAVNVQGSIAFYLGVIQAVEPGKYEVLSVMADGAVGAPGARSIQQNQIPRAILADFPELAF